MEKRANSGLDKNLSSFKAGRIPSRMQASSPTELDNCDTLPDLAPPKFLSANDQN